MHVAYLASDALEGRLTGSRGEELAARYIANQFQLYGLEPAGDAGTYYQRFAFSEKSSHKKKLLKQGRNVLARLKMGPDNHDVIIVGAHLDHLGFGEKGYSRGEVGKLHPGADDNASGIACMLEAASLLSQLKSQNKIHGDKDILFAAWSGEETGILGSSYFAKNTFKSAIKVNAVINLDMTGHYREKLVLQGTGSSPDWKTIINKIRSSHSISLLMQDDPWLPTDTTAFYLQAVPIINFFTGAHDNYHSSRDTADTLNYEGMQMITAFLKDLLLALEQSPDLRYQKIPGKDTASRHFKVYLGTIPDYAANDISGVRLSGVTSHSPAEKAGLKRNDVIIEFAGRKIKDIYDYSHVLSSVSPHKTEKIIVKRDNKRMVFSVKT